MISSTNAAQHSPTQNLSGENRNKNMNFFKLIEIERAEVVDSVEGENHLIADKVFAFGAMRELCPHCQSHHLKLVLRQKHVKQAHLFCDQCHACFDARNQDGSSALEMDE